MTGMPLFWGGVVEMELSLLALGVPIKGMSCFLHLILPFC